MHKLIFCGTNSMKIVLSAFLVTLAGAAALQENADATNSRVVRTDPTLFKRVRELVNIKGERDLEEQDVTTLRCFWECVNQGMTAEECQEYIEGLLGGPGLPNHVIPDLQIKINRPRPGPWLDATYWMIGIPVNLFGEVDCDINGGTISYPWTWTVGGQDYNIPDVPCLGKTATACCTDVIEAIENAQIPLVNDDGNCLSCWVHQEPLEPYIECGGSDLVYLEHEASGGTCSEIELTEAEVNDADAVVQAALVGVLADLQAAIDAGSILCSAFETLWQNLLFYGRSFPRAMSRIPQLLCDLCDDPNSILVLSDDMSKDLEWIKKELEGDIDSAENCIIIYTDREGLVMEPPKIGGSRAELDFDRDDPNCLVECEAPSFLEGCACVCPSNYLEIDGQCLPRPIDCVAPKTPNEQRECVCPPGYVTFEDTCACESGYQDPRGNCVPDPNDVCPPGTSYDPEYEACISCNCGFCPERSLRVGQTEECCTLNPAGNNCHAAGKNSNNKGCNFAKGPFYPGYSDQSGNVCSGVEVKLGAQIPVGCGCKPSATAPCTYDPTNEDRCFICSAEDLADNEECQGCRDCLASACANDWPTVHCLHYAMGTMTGTAAQWEACLAITARRRLRVLKGAPTTNKDCTLSCAEACYYGATYGP